MAMPLADIFRMVAWFTLTGVVVRWLVRHYRAWRRRSQSGHEWQDYKAALPGWVKAAERLIALVIYLAMLGLWFASISVWHRGAADDPRLGVFVVMGLFAFVAPAFLLANVISYAIPPLRRANLAAFAGLETSSFASANLGLLKFGAVVTVPALLVAAGVLLWPA
jgi:hypothetical protein